MRKTFTKKGATLGMKCTRFADFTKEGKLLIFKSKGAKDTKK